MTTFVRASVLSCPEWCEDDHADTANDRCQMHHQSEQAITAREGKACFYLTRYDEHDDRYGVTGSAPVPEVVRQATAPQRPRSALQRAPGVGRHHHH